MPCPEDPEISLRTAKVDPDMIRHHDVDVPRYTSYPTKNQILNGDFRT